MNHEEFEKRRKELIEEIEVKLKEIDAVKYRVEKLVETYADGIMAHYGIVRGDKVSIENVRGKRYEGYYMGVVRGYSNCYRFCLYKIKKDGSMSSVMLPALTIPNFNEIKFIEKI